MLTDHFPTEYSEVNRFRSRDVLSPLLVLLLALAGALPVSFAQPRLRTPARRAITPASRSPRPRLVLLIVVDQFRYDYLSRFGDLFGSRGIGRLMREGASWTETN